MTIKPTAILDTCVLVDILRKDKKTLKEKLSNIDLRKCGIIDLTRFELLCGAEESKDKEQNILLVNKLCSQFSIRPSACGHELAAKEKIRLKRKGELIPDIDLMIGAVCASEEIPIITGNIKHMKRITGIKIIPW